MIYVVAGTYGQFDAWLKGQTDFNPNKVRYVSADHKLMGLTPDRLYLTGTYYDNPYWSEINHYAKLKGWTYQWV